MAAHQESSHVMIVPEFEMNEGVEKETILDVFRKIKILIDTEPGTLFYDMCFTEDGKKFTIVERYSSANDWFTHDNANGKNVGELLENSSLLRLTVYGPTSEMPLLKEKLGKYEATFFITEFGRALL